MMSKKTTHKTLNFRTALKTLKRALMNGELINAVRISKMILAGNSHGC